MYDGCILEIGPISAGCAEARWSRPTDADAARTVPMGRGPLRALSKLPPSPRPPLLDQPSSAPARHVHARGCEGHPPRLCLCCRDGCWNRWMPYGTDWRLGASCPWRTRRVRWMDVDAARSHAKRLPRSSDVATTPPNTSPPANGTPHEEGGRGTEARHPTSAHLHTRLSVLLVAASCPSSPEPTGHMRWGGPSRRPIRMEPPSRVCECARPPGCPRDAGTQSRSKMRTLLRRWRKPTSMLMRRSYIRA